MDFCHPFRETGNSNILCYLYMLTVDKTPWNANFEINNSIGILSQLCEIQIVYSRMSVSIQHRYVYEWDLVACDTTSKSVAFFAFSSSNSIFSPYCNCYDCTKWTKNMKIWTKTIRNEMEHILFQRMWYYDNHIVRLWHMCTKRRTKKWKNY